MLENGRTKVMQRPGGSRNLRSNLKRKGSRASSAIRASLFDGDESALREHI
jgi:hypothetical protein